MKIKDTTYLLFVIVLMIGFVGVVFEIASKKRETQRLKYYEVQKKIIIIKKDTVIHCQRCKTKIAKTKIDINPLTLLANNAFIFYNHQYKTNDFFGCYKCGYSVMRTLRPYDIRKK